MRLALEESGADYRDVARMPKGMQALLGIIGKPSLRHAPFAPPVLKAGTVLLAQTANILHYLGPRLGLAPRAEAEQLWLHQLQLTVSDFVMEIHDTHHPLGPSLYYEQQKAAAMRRSADFRQHRMPKFLGYFEQVLQHNGSRGGYMVGGKLSYADLSMFQLIAGLRYAFPRALARQAKKYPGLLALHDRVAARPRIAAYLESEQRINFNEDGIFRHYPALDK